ncbi:hypothetical protein OEZ85_008076 [Tetradesmus obliquus]|uniref:Mediator of RNA polymerase II transcription subunit 25 von Willebrand factor type A domain-containing protein n=1 Tax=Tetradesmus obliquus TaxID=3088 RepID=A0ABY8THT8_TETOB|nr:hypothetical protein OEZ85_008076 [Tetradesmus obliquus]
MAAEGSDTFEPAAAANSRPHPTRVILLVEATAAATSSWRGTRKWLDSILHMMEKEAESQAAAAAADPAAKAAAAAGQQQDAKPSAASPASKQAIPRSQYALIVYATHDRSTPAPIQVSGWTPSLKQLFTWLDGIQFVGGVSSKGTALPHALAEAIALSKSPYPGGARPPAAAASHPGVLAMSDAEPGAHTHLIVVCPSFNPCRLPLAWPYAADTKARLFSCKHYQAFLERFGAMHADKQDRATHTLFGQLDFIRGSLVAVTPGTVDIWDLLLSLVRHRLSLSVISSRTQNSRGVLEFFAYANYCLASLKAACQRGMVVTSSLNVSVYLSPMFTEAQRAFKPIMHKLLQQAKKKAAAAQQQQQQQQQAAQHAQAQQGQQQAAGQQQVPGAMPVQPTMVQQQQQPQHQVVMMVQQHPQMMMQQQQQPQVMPGSFMPQQQQQQQQLMQQQQQQLMQQQQAVPMSGVQQQQPQQQMAAAGAATLTADKQRQSFWTGPVMLHLPELGVQAPLAELELISSSGANLEASWKHRQQVILQQVVKSDQLPLHLQYSSAQKAAGNKVAKVHFRVLQQGSAWKWMQDGVMSSPEKQLILLGNLTPQLKCLVVFGWQSLAPGKLPAAGTQISFMDGLFILSGVGT